MALYNGGGVRRLLSDFGLFYFVIHNIFFQFSRQGIRCLIRCYHSNSSGNGANWKNLFAECVWHVALNQFAQSDAMFIANCGG